MSSMSTQPNPRPAYLYLRYSSEMQGAGDSLRRQFERCNEALSKFNLYIKEKITDEAFSGYHGDNLLTGQLRDFVRRVHAGEIERDAFLVVESLDRLTRLQPSKAVDLVSGLLQKGLTIYQTSPECTFSYSNKKDEMMTLIMITLLSQRAHEESDTKSYRVKEAWLSRISRIMKGQQKIVVDRPPFWLDVVEKEFDVTEDDGRIVRKMLKCYEINQKRAKEVLRVLELLKVYGFKVACKIMNETYPCEKVWTVTAVQRLLESETLYGEFDLNIAMRKDGRKTLESRGLALPKIYPPIISKADFSELRELIKLRASGRGGGRKSTQFHNIFSGLAKCKLCGGSYRYLAKRSGYFYLVCSNSEVHMCKHSKVLSINYQMVEAAFLKHAQYFDFEKIFQIERQKDYSVELSAKEFELADKKNAFQTLLENIISRSGGAINNLYQQSLDNLEQQISDLALEVEELKSKQALKPKSGQFDELYDFLKNKDALLSVPENRSKVNAHLKRVIESVVIDNAKHYDAEDPLSHYNVLDIKFKDSEWNHQVYFNEQEVVNAREDCLRVIDMESQNEDGTEGLALLRLIQDEVPEAKRIVNANEN